MEIRIREIIEYARNIESESFAFYTAAMEVLKDRDAREASRELAEEEKVHFARLGRLLERQSLPGGSLDARIFGEVDLSSRMVPTMEITPESSPREILKVALQREERTRDQYRTFISFSDMAAAVVKLFEDLVDQEEGHARRIRALLERLDD